MYLGAQPCPANALRDIAVACRRTPMTVYKWVWGDQKPSDDMKIRLQALTNDEVRAADWLVVATRRRAA